MQSISIRYVYFTCLQLSYTFCCYLPTVLGTEFINDITNLWHRQMFHTNSKFLTGERLNLQLLYCGFSLNNKEIIIITEK